MSHYALLGQFCRLRIKRTHSTRGRARNQEVLAKKASYRYECYRDAWKVPTKPRTELLQCAPQFQNLPPKDAQ